MFFLNPFSLSLFIYFYLLQKSYTIGTYIIYNIYFIYVNRGVKHIRYIYIYIVLLYYITVELYIRPLQNYYAEK